MSKAPDKQNHNPAFIGYPKSTIVLATLLLGSLYTIATADKTSKQIQVVCAIIAAIAVMVIISSFVAIFCNRNNKKDVQENTVDASSNVANVSTQTNFAERGTQTDNTKKSVVERGTQTDDTQISVVNMSIQTENPPERAQVATAKPAAKPASMAPPPPPEPIPAQLNNGYKQPNAQTQAITAELVAKTPNAGAQNFYDDLQNAVQIRRNAVEAKSTTVSTTPSTTPPAVKSMAPPPTPQKPQVLPPMSPLPLPPFINGIISPTPLPPKTTKTEPQASNQNNGSNQYQDPTAVKSMAPPPLPPKPTKAKSQASNQNFDIQMHQVLQQRKIANYGTEDSMSSSQLTGILNTQTAHVIQQNAGVSSNMAPPPPPEPTKAKPQTGNKNNIPVENRDALFKQIRKGVKLKSADAKPAAAKPGTGNIVTDALRDQVGTIMTKSFTAAAQEKKAMHDLQYSFHNDFSLYPK
ncbi:MAG TPA: hypothetical protein DEQ74_00110 [Wolbachia sp.]|jgi:hypothetical protein|uniref:hypothetical protein n=1 Tax=Wolbachia endosymbiont of Pentalonia nigronervosa TaxID=1301914 RepID=UPI000ED9EE1B|nr:hypothetical protein [Wolbachia endosymbiont of Pentalonia nigronervosa]MBD0391444.1 hypothetical protein [Wolbachia endosymbiont of Pentalonia nigronervosa]HCE59232.1 hypothetical protein [Wolbachia sp.]